MALVAAKITKQLEAAILAELTSIFAKEQGADITSHQKIAKAVAKAVGQVLVSVLQQDAQVLAAIPTAGGPTSQATVAPGKIF